MRPLPQQPLSLQTPSTWTIVSRIHCLGLRTDPIAARGKNDSVLALAVARHKDGLLIGVIATFDRRDRKLQTRPSLSRLPVRYTAHHFGARRALQARLFVTDSPLTIRVEM